MDSSNRPRGESPHLTPPRRSRRGVVIDASLRFARSNPALVRYAYTNAAQLGVSAEELLLEAIGRVAASRRLSRQQ